MRGPFLIACFLVSTAFLGGCFRTAPIVSHDIYDVRGIVVSVDERAKSVRIDYEEIPGCPPGFPQGRQTKSCPVEDAKLLGGLVVGDVVEGKLKVTTIDQSHKLSNQSKSYEYVLTDLHKTKN